MCRRSAQSPVYECTRATASGRWVPSERNARVIEWLQSVWAYLVLAFGVVSSLIAFLRTELGGRVLARCRSSAYRASAWIRIVSTNGRVRPLGAAATLAAFTSFGGSMFLATSEMSRSIPNRGERGSTDKTTRFEEVDRLPSVNAAPPVGGWLPAACLAFSGTSLFLLASRERTYARRSAYGLAMKSVHDAVHLARNRFDSAGRLNESELGDYLERVLDRVVRAFEIVSQRQCRASIHVLFDAGDYDSRRLAGPLDADDRSRLVEVAQVKTLSRDSTTEGRLPQDKKRENQRAYALRSCTQFIDVFLDQTGRAPAHSYVPDYPTMINVPGFKHAMFDVGQPPARFPWPLDYKSAMVWPIRNRAQEGRITLIGFLCVDSHAKYAFDASVDSELGAAIADMLYMYLWQWHEESQRVAASTGESSPMGG